MSSYEFGEKDSTYQNDNVQGRYTNTVKMKVSPLNDVAYVNGNGKINGYTNGTMENVYDTIDGEKKLDAEKPLDEATEMNGENKEEKGKEPPKMVGVFEIFRFADGLDKVLMLFGTLCAMANGAAMPLMVIVFGDMTDMFVNDELFKNIVDMVVANITEMYPNITYYYNLTDIENNPELLINISRALNLTFEEQLKDALTADMMDQMQTYSIYYSILGALVLFLGYVQVCFWQIACIRQTQRVRVRLFYSILRQEIGWFDTQPPGQLNTRLSDDVNKISAGIGEKLSLFFQHMSTFFTGFIIGFVYGWELTLVILSVSPLLAIAAAVITKMMATMTSKELKAYAKAGAVAEEVLSCIRTVTAFGGQRKECDRYNGNLRDARRFGIRKGFVNGGSMGLIFFLIFNIYALAFWYGSKLVREDEDYTAGTMMIVFFSVIFGAFSIGNAAPNLGDFATARGAAHIIYDIIDMVPKIDSYSPEGITPKGFEGNIAFRNVIFRYPSRPTVPVLQGLSFEVKVGQTVALVGSSGCGKSTTVQLLQRFYDPLDGEVLIDGLDVRKYNIKWLRQHIGVVSQEPVLFASSIAENIRFGRDGVSKEEIELAARQANAHDFISKLPKGYDTLVGERGAQLSGGQKQRIAIARALVRNPKILLLDEATSALDNESESIVQDALDKARLGRTTIVIAHRLSTIKTADVIIGVKEGVVTEEGSHEKLMELKGLYYQLVTNQTRKPSSEEVEEEVADESKVSLARMVSIKEEEPQFERLTSRTGSTKRERHRTVSTSSQKKEEENLPEAEWKRILKMNSPEWHIILLGSLTATVVGCIQPAFALIFSNILGVFSMIDLEEQKQAIEKYCVMFCIIGVIAGASMFCMQYMFALSGESLTMRIRQSTFIAMLRQEMGFFDLPEHNTGALCTKLATDASAVQGATGARLGMLVQSLAGITAALIIGFVFSWQLTLIILAFAPFMMISGIIRARMIFGAGKGTESNEALEQGGKVATESTENMRTVATLTKEEYFYKEYCHFTGQPYKHELKMTHLHGFSYGFSQAIMFFAYAASFYAGAYFVNEGINEYEDIYKVFSAIVFGAMSVGQASSFAPDYGKAKLAAARVFVLLDREPLIDSLSEEGKKPTTAEGHVAFKNVHFSYPTRSDVPVLRGIEITAQPGQRIALVGTSGCGKSTTVQLLERFYDPHQGEVLVDHNNTKSLNVQWLRNQIGIVSQEPVLFNCSIRDNIAYGDNTRNIPMTEIIEAAKMANVHNFITSLPNGYDTEVGDKGTQLSGGQKQRVAIARALVRNPKILLLDEATSALDTESEKIVQEALDRAQQGRTSIVIAHRLSTIQDADLIVCMKNGKVLEQGKYSELMAMKGFYYRLHMAQLKK